MHIALPACKSVWAALRSVGVKAGDPVAVIWDIDGPTRAVGIVRAGLALPLVVPWVKAVCLLLTFPADVVVILLAGLAPSVHQPEFCHENGQQMALSSIGTTASHSGITNNFPWRHGGSRCTEEFVVQPCLTPLLRGPCGNELAVVL